MSAKVCPTSLARANDATTDPSMTVTARTFFLPVHFSSSPISSIHLRKWSPAYVLNAAPAFSRCIRASVVPARGHHMAGP